MALQGSGQISLSDVNVELGNSATAQISLGGANTRGLFGIASGEISLSDGYGKANAFLFTISSAQSDANLATLATAAGWDGSTAVEATIDTGVYISSTSTSSAALTIDGTWAGGVTLINNGYIVGKGGNGGNGGSMPSSPQSGFSGGSGGIGLSVSSACTIDNTNGVIAGGGGGGGGGGAVYGNFPFGDGDTRHIAAGGGGGGGGRSSSSSSSGGSGGTVASWVHIKANGGGGQSGTTSNPGNGANGGYASGYGNWARGGAGGAGGAWGASGSTGGSSSASISGYAGNTGGGSAGSGGAATSGASNITWTATGTRYGTIG